MEIFLAEITSISFFHQTKKRSLFWQCTWSFQSHSYFVAYRRSLSLKKYKETCSEPELRGAVIASQEVLRILSWEHQNSGSKN